MPRTYRYDSVKEIVENDKFYQKWISKCKAQATVSNKRSSMFKFLHYIHNDMGMSDATPTTLITHALFHQRQKTDKLNGDITSPDDYVNILLSDDDDLGDTERILHEYKKYLLNNFKSGTANTSFSNVMNFYRYFKVDVSDVDAKINASSSIYTKKKPKFNTLKKVMQQAKLRNKCIMSCGITSGMARADVSDFTYGEFIDGLEALKDENGEIIRDEDGEPVEICRLELKRHKNETPYHTFLAPETVSLVKEYIGWRNRPPLDSTVSDILLLKRKIYSKSDKIFLVDNVRDEFLDSIKYDTQGNVISYDDSKRAMKPSTLSRMYCRESDRNGIERIDGEYSTIRSHAMRHHFSNAYKSIDNDMKEHMMGHGGKSSKITYEEYDEEEGLEVYLQGLDGVTILGHVDTISPASPSVEKMRSQYEEEMQQRDAQNAEILERLRLLETQNQLHSSMNLIKGMSHTYDLSEGKLTSVEDENKYAVLIAKKIIKRMDSDQTFDPVNMPDEVRNDIIAEIQAEYDHEITPGEFERYMVYIHKWFPGLLKPEE